MGNHHKLNRKCITCNCNIYDENKSGYCKKHNKYGINNPFYNKHHTKETREHLSYTSTITNIEKWKNPEYRKKVIKAVSKPRSEIGKQNISKGVKESYNKFPELRIERGELMKKYWKDGTIVKNNYSCNKSKIQSKLFEDVKLLLPKNDVKENEVISYNNKWLFPDILIKDLKIVIEYNGDYWHANPKKYKSDDKIKSGLAKNIWEKDKKRIKLLNKLGYMVIIVWQLDYKKNKQKILQKIKKQVNDRDKRKI